MYYCILYIARDMIVFVHLEHAIILYAKLCIIVEKKKLSHVITVILCNTSNMCIHLYCLPIYSKLSVHSDNYIVTTAACSLTMVPWGLTAYYFH